jgi:flavin-dependent dehydrogenase
MKKTYDVIVVGAGTSGMMAAVSAAESGASVLLIEKNKKAGGKNC